MTSDYSHYNLTARLNVSRQKAVKFTLIWIELGNEPNHVAVLTPQIIITVPVRSVDGSYFWKCPSGLVRFVCLAGADCCADV